MRALRGARDDGKGDGPAAVLAQAVRGLPAERAEWGSAMCAELARVEGGRARAMRMRSSVTTPDRGGNGLRGSLLVALAMAVALAVYGLVRYPALRAGVGAWAAMVLFLLLAFGYAATALALSRGTTPGAVAARRYGLAGGLCVGAAWLMVAAPSPTRQDLVFVPLAAALLGPAVAAALAGRSSGDARAATGAAVWSGLVGALLAFIIWVTATYVREGRPYDAQMMRDFHASGARDLAAYAVGDNLGAALGMLLFVPVVALALGSLAARVTAARAR